MKQFKVDIEVMHKDDGRQRASLTMKLRDDEHESEVPSDDVRGKFWNSTYARLEDAGFVDPYRVISVRIIDVTEVK